MTNQSIIYNLQVQFCEINRYLVASHKDGVTRFGNDDERDGFNEERRFAATPRDETWKQIQNFIRLTLEQVMEILL